MVVIVVVYFVWFGSWFGSSNPISSGPIVWGLWCECLLMAGWTWWGRTACLMRQKAEKNQKEDIDGH